MSEFRYREIAPRASLRRHIECFWTLSSAAVAPVSPPQRILPDGRVELILNFADAFEQFAGGRGRRQPLRFVVGQMDRPIFIAPTGRVDLLGVRFRPAGARAFLNAPLVELTGRIEPLDAVAFGLDRAIRNRMSAVPAERLRAIESVFEPLALVDSRADECVEGAVDYILRRRGIVAISALSHGSGVSARQLERKFRERVGLSPKTLCRIVRFQNVFQAVACGAGVCWADVALSCGYYDQAHFIHDFRRFAGETPASLLAQMPELTEVFARGNSPSHSYNTQAQPAP